MTPEDQARLVEIWAANDNPHASEGDLRLALASAIRLITDAATAGKPLPRRSSMTLQDEIVEIIATWMKSYQGSYDDAGGRGPSWVADRILALLPPRAEAIDETELAKLLARDTRPPVETLEEAHCNLTADLHRLAAALRAARPPREPTPAMVEAMAIKLFPNGSAERRKLWHGDIRAAWAAGYAKGEEG